MEPPRDAQLLLEQIALRSAQIASDEQSRPPPQKNFIPRLWKTNADRLVCLFLVSVPLGIIAETTRSPPAVVFVLNVVAIVPFTFTLGLAAETLSMRLGSTLRSLCRATLGNVWDILIGITALAFNDIRLVQLSMLGSIMTNLLVVLGCCFVAAGINHHEQIFNPTVASTRSSLISVVSASLIIVASIYGTSSRPLDAQSAVLVVSRGTSIVLLALYTLYLVFHLRTHSDLFITETDRGDDNEMASSQQVFNPAATLSAAILSLAALSLCARNLISSLAGFGQAVHISKNFIGLIILPLAGNAAKHVTAVAAATKSRPELANAIAIGSCLRTAMFVTPLLVIFGWLTDRPMTLYFGMFETVAFSISTFVVTLLLQDGKSNYLEGALCLAMYTIIALAVFLLPGQVSPPL